MSVWLYFKITSTAIENTNLLLGGLGLSLIIIILCFLFTRQFCKLSHSNYIPGTQCNRYLQTVVFLFYIWKRKQHLSLSLSEGLFGAANIFQKEGIFRFWVFNRPFIVIINAAMTEILLGNNQDINAKALQYNYLKPWLNEGLLLSMGKKWKLRRKLLTPAFHFNILESFVPHLNSKSKQLATLIEEKNGSDWIDFNSLATRCTLDMLFESILGIHLESMLDSECPYIYHTDILKHVVTKRFCNPLLHYDFMFNLTQYSKKFHKSVEYVNAYHKKIIRTRKDEIMNNPELKKEFQVSFETNTYKSKTSFLDLLLCQNIFMKSMNEEDIEEEVSTFIFEGHDTTAIAITAVLFHLANSPDVQEKVQQEIDFIFGEDELDLTIENIKRFQYLDRVIKETLRLTPSVPMVGRYTLDKIKIGDYQVEQGTTVGIFVSAIHLDPKYYENPLVFNPDNFLPEKCLERPPCAFLPFSIGLRNCIGQRFAQMELKIVLATLLRRFTVKSLYRRDEVQYTSEIVLTFMPEIMLKFVKR